MSISGSGTRASLKTGKRQISMTKKERIVLREIHLRTTGRHLSMGSHSVICHPTEVTAPPRHLTSLRLNSLQLSSTLDKQDNSQLSTSVESVCSVKEVWKSGTAGEMPPPKMYFYLVMACLGAIYGDCVSDVADNTVLAWSNPGYA